MSLFIISPAPFFLKITLTISSSSYFYMDIKVSLLTFLQKQKTKTKEDNQLNFSFGLKRFYTLIWGESVMTFFYYGVSQFVYKVYHSF